MTGAGPPMMAGGQRQLPPGSMRPAGLTQVPLPESIRWLAFLNLNFIFHQKHVLSCSLPLKRLFFAEGNSLTGQGILIMELACHLAPICMCGVTSRKAVLLVLLRDCCVNWQGMQPRNPGQMAMQSPGLPGQPSLQPSGMSQAGMGQQPQGGMQMGGQPQGQGIGPGQVPYTSQSPQQMQLKQLFPSLHCS